MTSIPPDNTIGCLIFNSDIFFNNSVSMPLKVPSLSTEVIQISPTPKNDACFIQSFIFLPEFSLPLLVKAYQSFEIFCFY